MAPSGSSGTTNRGGNGSSGSGSGSSRPSRASGMMMSLFGRRGRRERSNSDSSSPFRVPVVDDVFLKASVPSHIRNNNGWENMPAPPYEHSLGGITTTGTTTGAPYALSNIPAHVYLLQPQQAVPTTTTGGSNNENNPGLMGQPLASSPLVAPPQPGFVPHFFPYPPPNMYPWPQSSIPGQMMPVPMPIHGFVPPNGNITSQGGYQSQMPANNGNVEEPRTLSSRPSSHTTERERGSSPLRKSRRHARQLSYDSLVAEGKHRARRSTTPSMPRRHLSPHRKHHYRPRSPSKKIRPHICNGCGRVRSRKFHDANPIRAGKKAITNFCRKCRSFLDLERDD